ncbi:MAG: hypothetical protein CITR_04163 [Citrobacter freundii]
MTRFARPSGSPLTPFAVCPAGCASSRTPVGASHPPVDVQHAKKNPVLAYELFLKYGGEGGLTRFARPCGAARSLRSRSVQLAAPVVEPRSGLLIPPQMCNMRKKSPYLRTSSSQNMAMRGGLTRFARPSGSPLTPFAVCPTGCASSRTPVGVSHPPVDVQHAKKKPVLSYELFLKYGGEGGIRTPDTLPYTHFPGVLLQPLGHLTILLFLCYRNGR